MTARRFVLSTSIALLGLALLPLVKVHAQPSDVPPSTPEIEDSKYHFTGLVNSNAVYVRSGPSENDYPTMKLDKGAELTVRGIKYEWLKVEPPQGSFCYVAKAFVDRHGNGSSGRVTSTLNVRVGSQLNELKAKIASKLEPGAAVEIVGEEQEYFKIRPPAGVYFYVNKQFVDPVAPIDDKVARNNSQPTPPADTGAQQPEAQQPAQPEATATNEPPIVTEQPKERTAQVPDDPAPADSRVADNTDPGAAPAPFDTTPAPTPTPPYQPPAARNNAPAAQPGGNAEAEFERLENAYAEATVKPLADQPVKELLEGYDKLASGTELPESLRRIAEFKTEVLKHRLEIQQQLTDTRKQMDEMNQKQMALKSEREELEQRIKESDIRFYTAVGTLRPSSLQQGAETLYRLTDPANGRTVVYVRTNDEKLAAMLGQFIGVRGEVQSDGRLNVRVITPTEFEQVNPAKVGDKVAAQIVPPSLLPGARAPDAAGTARTDQ